MSVRSQFPHSKPQIHSFTPDDPIPTDAPPELRAVPPSRLRYRPRFIWNDGGKVREEVGKPFADPRALLRLLHAIQTKPDRPLLRMSVEAMARPHWQEVPLKWIAARADQRERRENRGGR